MPVQAGRLVVVSNQLWLQLKFCTTMKMDLPMNPMFKQIRASSRRPRETFTAGIFHVFLEAASGRVSGTSPMHRHRALHSRVSLVGGRKAGVSVGTD